MTHRRTQQRGTLRLLRAGLLAGSSATLAVAAHALAGGGTQDTGLTVILTLLIACAGTALAERGTRGGTLGLIGVLGVSHLIEHLLLTVAHEHPTVPNGALMTGTHLLALLLTAGLLGAAERGLSSALAALGMLLPRFRLGPPPPPAPARLPVRRWFRPLRTEYSVLLRRILGRRGPPVCPE